jgi:predicted nucleic acid-binding protein
MTFDQFLDAARALPRSQQMELLHALAREPVPESPGSGRGLPLQQFSDLAATRPDVADPEAWARRERGHAVLAQHAPRAADLPEGPAALVGMMATVPATAAVVERLAQASTGGGAPPAIVGTDVVMALARAEEPAIGWFAEPPCTPRLTTPTYLHLLASAHDREELTRIQRFAAVYAILSLGPVASNRAVQIVAESGVAGLSPLAALLAATALAHEIPVYTSDLAVASVPGLQTVAPW